MVLRAVTASRSPSFGPRTCGGSSQGGECVEVAMLSDGGWAVRDSKDPQGGVLLFTAAEWSAFLDGAKTGEFDL
jgi:Domain of unknown function (DUF397)